MLEIFPKEQKMINTVNGGQGNNNNLPQIPDVQNHQDNAIKEIYARLQRLEDEKAE